MSRLSFAVFAAATIAAACYQDEALPASPMTAGAKAKVFLTDAPFPFDSVQSVQVYVVSIALSTHPDTGTSADSMHWVTVAAPHRQIDLLTLQQGLTDSLGIGQVTADQYKAVLVTLNVDSSAGIRFKNGSQAVVQWNGSGLESYGSFVEAPINVPDTGPAPCSTMRASEAPSVPWRTRRSAPGPEVPPTGLSCRRARRTRRVTIGSHICCPAVT
ncbi:MAG: hypothetical protein AUG85_13305 [Gemmatimonadetes bacterium 13_1_20CM_4_66_11]|nr:MAG: hypothetical protein AUG85_13305 [Gemmatimonadetes bacterium 13_1_20CM_4_66_11]